MNEERQPNRRARFRPRHIALRHGWSALRNRDLYHWFLTLPLPAIAGLCVAAYMLVNLLFATLYFLQPDGIANARPGSFADAFFFSVETVATIGYGQMYPRTNLAGAVMTIETVTGLLFFALVTGLLFTRFSRPVARVLFSRVVVITDYEGVPTLMFRIANERRNQILQAGVEVTLLRAEYSPEGVMMWRQRDLALVRSHTSFFSLSWTVMHRIDRDSPLWGETAGSLAEKDVEIAVLLTGVDETLNQTVHARHVYAVADLKWNHRFADVLGEADGESTLDLARFHDVHRTEA